MNRLTAARELTGSQTLWQQSYLYEDQFGNRRINTSPSETWGFGINNLGSEVETATNRLYAPDDLAIQESSRRIRYDGAGNQTKDYYTLPGANFDRAYDAENRMTTATRAGDSPSVYTYSADGQRVRRMVNGVETWQVYGMDGELLAEYAAGGLVTSPQKEYGLSQWTVADCD